MRRAPSLRFPLREDRGPGLSLGPQKTERARSPFGAPPRHPRFFRPRLGSGRASWNHRMQTGGPSPAPVQRAPRGPTRAGRDDAQAARERSVSLRSTRTAPAPPQGVPSRKASLCERDVGYVTAIGIKSRAMSLYWGLFDRCDCASSLFQPNASRMKPEADVLIRGKLVDFVREMLNLSLSNLGVDSWHV